MLRKLLFLITYLLLVTAVYYSSAQEPQKYSRQNWYHWADEDSDCQSTRSEVLIRDSHEPVIFKTPKNCIPKFGLWICPYTTYQYREPSRLDIDHVVPLFNAFKSGAASWSKEKKRLFANDMDNLIAVNARSNRQKGAKGPSEWRPDNVELWKAYAFKWIRIKERYGLTYTQAELNALFLMFSGEPLVGDQLND